MRLDLPYPAKVLWPNGRTLNKRYLNAEFQKHRGWACIAARADLSAFQASDPVPVHITVHGKPRGPLPDKDGVVGASKSYLDGIADAIRVNDKNFAAPTVEFAPERTSRFVIEVGA